MMKRKKLGAKTPLQHLQNDYNRLGKIKQHCEQLQQLESLVYRYLAEELQPHCDVLNYRTGILILKCESSAWATRLRFQIPHLLRFLRREKKLSDIVSINVVVRPENENHTNDPNKPSPTLTPAAKNNLQQCAESLAPSDLKDIIDKMAKPSRLRQ